MSDLEHITFRQDERTLHADIHHADGDWAALILHGWTGYRGGSSGALAQKLTGLGAASLCVDLPGHGDSDGKRNKISRPSFLRAAEAAYDQLVSVAPNRKILVVGTSFGGYLAARLVGHKQADALALRVPANYEPFADALDAVQSFDGPLFVLQAELDEVIPPWMVSDYVLAAKNVKYVLLDGAPHSISTVPAKLTESNEMLAKWLESLS